MERRRTEQTRKGKVSGFHSVFSNEAPRGGGVVVVAAAAGAVVVVGGGGSS